MKVKNKVNRFSDAIYDVISEKQHKSPSLLNFSVDGKDFAFPYGYITSLTFCFLNDGYERIFVQFSSLASVTVWGMGLRPLHRHMLNREVISVQEGYQDGVEIVRIDMKAKL